MDRADRFALATDVVLLGLLTTVAALPVGTAGAALATGSGAVRHRYRTGSLPAMRDLAREYRARLLPGLAATAVAGGVTAAVVLDLAALRRGTVPGGPVMVAVTLAVAGWLLGVATLTLVRLGREPAAGWVAAARWAGRRPVAAVVLALVGVLAAVLGLSVPATAPLLVGAHLFAAHVVADRLLPESGPAATQRDRSGSRHPA